jgi:DNA-binding GntR family transcriptional regulator
MFRHPELLQISLKREYLEHKSIIEALARNDPQAASFQVTNHIRNLGNEIEMYLDISGESIRELENLIDPMISYH